MVSSGFFLLLHSLKKGHYVDMKKIVLLMATMPGALGIMTSCEDDTQEPEPPKIETGYILKGTMKGTLVNQEDTSDSLAVDLNFSQTSF